MGLNAAIFDSNEVGLLRGAALGDPDAARSLLDDYLPTVYGFVFARVGGDEAAAQDILQETVVEAIKSADSFRGESQLKTWLCTIARRRIFHHFKSERREAVVASKLSLVDSEKLESEERDEVVRALGSLPALHRQVLVLKYLDGLSVKEIADEFGRPGVQVQSLLQRARDGFKKQMEAGRG
jgi:RNA polymerase sigma-70 factor (ECF subfamily)